MKITNIICHSRRFVLVRSSEALEGRVSVYQRMVIVLSLMALMSKNYWNYLLTYVDAYCKKVVVLYVIDAQVYIYTHRVAPLIV